MKLDITNPMHMIVEDYRNGDLSFDQAADKLVKFMDCEGYRASVMELVKPRLKKGQYLFSIGHTRIKGFRSGFKYMVVKVNRFTYQFERIDIFGKRYTTHHARQWVKSGNQRVWLFFADIARVDKALWTYEGARNAFSLAGYLRLTDDTPIRERTEGDETGRTQKYNDAARLRRWAKYPNTKRYNKRRNE